MSEFTPATILAVFLIFCRIGSCVMIMPGLSSARVPMQMRLFVAAGLALALTPLLLDTVRPAVGTGAPIVLFALIATEIFAGAVIGFIGRLFFLALQFGASAISNFMGLSALPGVPIDEPEANPALVSIITMGATVLFFITDLHWAMISGVIASYAAWPVGGVFSAQWGLMQVADQLNQAFLLALRVCAPFLVFTVVINLAVGLINKLTPQIPVYFISMPFVIAGGLLIAYFSAEDSLRIFMLGFGRWVTSQ